MSVKLPAPVSSRPLSNSNMPKTLKPRKSNRWYHEPWAVFAFALPLTAVVAGVITVFIAINGADVEVSDGVSRFGIQQQTP